MKILRSDLGRYVEELYKSRDVKDEKFAYALQKNFAKVYSVYSETFVKIGRCDGVEEYLAEKGKLDISSEDELKDLNIRMFDQYEKVEEWGRNRRDVLGEEVEIDFFKCKLPEGVNKMALNFMDNDI